MAKQNRDGHATASGKHISVEVEDPNTLLATSIRKMIRDIPPISPDCYIFRAPKLFRQFNEKAFNPSLVSIGPFHHGREDLQSMEKRKVAYLDTFLTRTKISLETCVNMIREWENRVRNCCAETIEFSSDDFVKMILLDSCFVIELMWRNYYFDSQQGTVDHLSHPRILTDIMIDMILLENQLPFFVLEGLFNLAFPNSIGTSECFSNLCIEYFAALLICADVSLAQENFGWQQKTEIKHLLDLFRKCQAPAIQRESPEDFPVEITMRKATELEEAGMVIKPGWNQSSATDIRYTRGILEIPALIITTISEPVLKNLIVLEWCLYYDNTYIADYIHFMDSLIDTSKDVELLVRKGIIDSFSSDSHEVATLFNNLRPYCLLSNYFYYGIQQKINAYCKVPRHK